MDEMKQLSEYDENYKIIILMKWIYFCWWKKKKTMREQSDGNRSTLTNNNLIPLFYSCDLFANWNKLNFRHLINFYQLMENI